MSGSSIGRTWAEIVAQDRAYSKVYRAVLSGEIKKGKCPCGKEKVEAHHKDYKRPLDVEWLCRKCHKGLHATINRKQKNKATIINKHEGL